MNNPYEKLPENLHFFIDEEVEIRLNEFYEKNPTIVLKLTEEDKEKIEDWILAMTTYEYYREYEITEEELEQYIKHNKIELREDLPKFRNLKKGE